MHRKKICILVFSNIASDGRVLREVEHVRYEYEVDVIAYGPWVAPENVNYFQLIKPDSSSILQNVLRLTYLTAGKFMPKFFERGFWQKPEYGQALQIIKRGQYDLIHANDWDALPVACAAVEGTRTRILFDAHEYTPGQYTQHFTGRYIKSQYFEYMLRACSPTIDGMITVSDGIAKLYEENFGWNPTVVRNAPKYVSVDTHSVDPTSIRLVHHGGAIRKRSLDSLIHLVSLLDNRFNLTFILVPTDKKYLSQLKELADRLTPRRISFLNPVSPATLPTVLSFYDVGIHLLTDVNLNHQYALPNKLFDFIMAGLGVAVSPLPEMAKVVRDNQIGVVSVDQSINSMAKALNSLSPEQINVFKKNSLTLAKTLNGDVEMQKLMDIYAGLLSA